MSGRSCKNGHRRTPENTVERFGIRTCLDCARSGGGRKSAPAARRPRKRRAAQPRPDDDALLTAAVAVVLDGVPARAAAADHGVPEADVKVQAWAWAKERVRDRDGDRCWRCGAYGQHDVHHRRGRQSGGTSDPRVAYGLANLLLLCRDCHQWAEAHLDDAAARGLRVRSHDNPADIPVTAAAGEPVWLTHRGTTTKDRP